MRGNSRAVPRQPAIQTVIYEVRFEKRQTRGSGTLAPANAGRVPRVTHLLALAHRIDGMIRCGEIRDWADAARLAGVTRARMTQIANLLLLTPMIQEGILNLAKATRGPDPVTEHALREVAAHADWGRQEVPWSERTH